MTLFQSIILGILQGITEFLPVSSSLHLAVASGLMGLQNQRYAFDICLNFGSLLAILVFYWKDIRAMMIGCWNIIMNRQRSKDVEFFGILIISNFPTIIVFGIADLFFDINFNFSIAPFTVIFFAIILLLCDRTAPNKKAVSLLDGILVGLAQSISLVPGISRLGITLSVMRYLGYSCSDSFRFSLLLSIPVVSGIIFVTACKIYVGKVIVAGAMLLTAGCLFAFLFGLLSISLMTMFLKKHSFLGLVIYRIIFGLFLGIYFNSSK
ncbi:MAG: undecaprenyl-diphosphate phosphatase [Holosporaceae bacterium]|jgi:undecaprenyl-diphosphatase|nr:undecaprenyl-diphosphate phosphatase [Holosporaceae bacterium]